MTVRRKLGRGLQSLLGVVDFEESDDATGADEPLLNEAPPSIPMETEHHAVTPLSLVPMSDEPPPSHSANIRPLAVAEIDPNNPFQPRQDFDAQEMAALVDSIRVHGVIQPIVVRRTNGRYQLVAGERRFRAAVEAGLSQIPAVVMELDDRETFEVALVENLQRRDLNAIEKAEAFSRYIAQFETTHEELAGQLGVDRSSVTNLLRLLELPEVVRDAVRVGQITFGHAKAILSVEDPVARVSLCRSIIDRQLSVREAEALARTEREPSAKTPKADKPGKSNHVQSIENDLRQRLGAKVEIKPRAKEKGFIAIHFESNDEFERVIALLTGSDGR